MRRQAGQSRTPFGRFIADGDQRKNLCGRKHTAAADLQVVGPRDAYHAYSRLYTQPWGFVVGLLDGILGNASEIEPARVQQSFAQILMPGERVDKAYQLVRDLFFFTDKRLVVVDKQGVTGQKVEYHSIPYRSIVRFSVETAGHFDLDAELRIWVTGATAPIQKQFTKRVNVYEVQTVLGSYVLK